VEYWYLIVIIILVVVSIKFQLEIRSLWKNTIRSRSEEGEEKGEGKRGGKGEEEVDLSYLTDIGPGDEEDNKKD
jgi:hypothetical protein